MHAVNGGKKNIEMQNNDVNGRIYPIRNIFRSGVIARVTLAAC